MKHSPAYLVVIGTSAGGSAALAQLVPQLLPKTNAAYCILMHLSNSDVKQFLVKSLQQYTSLPCLAAEDGEVLKKGHIYIAQPGHHLLIKNRKLLTGYGAEENNFRPSIDVLFRSAAAAYGSYCIGVMLTGMMYDGTSGMEAIQSCGGTLITQDVEEAEFPSMPLSVNRNSEVDFSCKLADMGKTIMDITDSKKIKEAPISLAILAEVKRSEKMAIGIEGMEELGARSVYGCPDCGGGLWEVTIENGVKRYKCHIGHSYIEKELLFKQMQHSSTAIWKAVRIMEERKHLLTARVVEYSERGHKKTAADYQRKAADIKDNIEQLKSLLLSLDSQY